MPTKKELEERFHLKVSTVYKTLKACGLDTSKLEYTDEEIEEYFVPARKLIDEGKTFRDVSEWARTKRGEETLPEEAPNEDSEPTGETFQSVVQEETIELVKDAVEEIVKDVIPQIPNMARAALRSQALKGNIRQAFRLEREKFRDELRGSSYDYYRDVYDDNGGGGGLQGEMRKVYQIKGVEEDTEDGQ